MRLSNRVVSVLLLVLPLFGQHAQLGRKGRQVDRTTARKLDPPSRSPRRDRLLPPIPARSPSDDSFETAGKFPPLLKPAEDRLRRLVRRVRPTSSPAVPAREDPVNPM